MLSGSLKIASTFAVPLIAFLIYKREKKNPERIDYENKFNHDLFNLSTAVVSNSIGSIVKIPANKIFEIANENNFGFLNKLRISDNHKNLLAILLIDFYMYNWHKINHKYKILWIFHKFHHQDKNMSASSGVRFHVCEIIFSEIFRTIILIPLGISKQQISYYEKVLLPVIIFHHSNIKINDKTDEIINKIIASPGFHRLHHSNKKIEADSNYGSVFSFWDRLFKTYNKNKASNKIKFGI